MATFQPHNTFRSTPTLRPASGFFGPSKTDRLVGELRRAGDAMDGWTRMHDDARAKLGQANRKRPAVRRMHQAMALRSLNAVRAGMRANERSITRLQAELLALDMPGADARS